MKKKMLILIFVFLLKVLFTPFNIKAATIEDVFNLISTRENINIPSIDVEYMALDNSCSNDDYIGFEEHCINSYAASLVQAYINDKLEPIRQNEPQFTYFVSECTSKNSCSVTITKYSTGGESTVTDTKTFNINYTQAYDQEKFDYIKTYTSNIKSFHLYDISFLNEMNNYLDGTDAVFNNIHILKIFPELKQMIENNPRLGLMIGLNGFGGTDITSGNSGNIFVTYDGIIYGSAEDVYFNLEHIVFISDETDDTIEAARQAALARITNFINDDSKTITLEYNSEISDNLHDLEIVEPTFAQTILAFVNKNLNLTSEASIVGTYDLSIVKDFGDNRGVGEQKPITLVRIPAEKLAGLNFTVQSFDFENNIIMYTGSSSVPLDTRITAENVLNSDYVKNALKDSAEVLIAAYDLNLYSTINQSYITSIKEGVEVLIPISDEYNEATLKVFYITDGGEKGEEFTGTVVTIDGQKYVKFTTTHFSTYAIVEPNAQSTNVDNPETYDGIKTYMYLGSISFIGILVIKLYSKKQLRKN